jgi:hypothetical protein
MGRRRKQNAVLCTMSYYNRSCEYYVSNAQASCAILSMAPNICSSAKVSRVNFKINVVRDEISVDRFPRYIIFVKFALHIDTAFSPKDMLLFAAQTLQSRDVRVLKYLCHQPCSLNIYFLFVVIACDIDSMTWAMLTRKG